MAEFYIDARKPASGTKSGSEPGAERKFRLSEVNERQVVFDDLADLIGVCPVTEGLKQGLRFGERLGAV